MEKQIYYFINYEKELSAVGEIVPSYMAKNGYTLVDKATYDAFVEAHRKDEEDEE